MHQALLHALSAHSPSHTSFDARGITPLHLDCIVYLCTLLKWHVTNRNALVMNRTICLKDARTLCMAESSRKNKAHNANLTCRTLIIFFTWEVDYHYGADVDYHAADWVGGGIFARHHKHNRSKLVNWWGRERTWCVKYKMHPSSVQVYIGCVISNRVK